MNMLASTHVKVYSSTQMKAILHKFGSRDAGAVQSVDRCLTKVNLTLMLVLKK